MRKRGRPSSSDILTPTEWRVADAVRHGLTNPIIAKRLGVSTDAVKFHVSNILQKLQMPSRAHLRLWDGVRESSKMSGRRRTESVRAAAPNSGEAESSVRSCVQPWVGPVMQVSRTVKDLYAAKTWYRDVLGMPILLDFETLCFVDCGAFRLMLMQSKTLAGESILYFSTLNLHATYNHLKQRGVEFTHAPHLIHRHPDGAEEWMAFFKDHEGRALGLMSKVGPNALSSFP